MTRDDELGRRILAAVLSYQLGNKSIDNTRKKYVGTDPIHPSWEKIGRQLLRNMTDRVASTLTDDTKDDS